MKNAVKAFGVLALTLCGTANAGVIYEDIAPGEYNLNNLGLNTYLGTTAAGDRDIFTFNVASGQQVTDAKFSATYDGETSINYNLNTFSYLSDGVSSSTTFSDTFISPSPYFEMDLGSFDAGGIFAVNANNDDFPVNYRFDFTVASVPEPGTLGLLGAGLLGLIAVRSRRT